jgi:excisionase family DNA binding protein
MVCADGSPLNARRDHDELWTVDDVAAYCKVPKATVYKWNAIGSGPAYCRLGRHARYWKSDVINWVAQQVDASRAR